MNTYEVTYRIAKGPDGEDVFATTYVDARHMTTDDNILIFEDANGEVVELFAAGVWTHAEKSR